MTSSHHPLIGQVADLGVADLGIGLLVVVTVLVAVRRGRGLLGAVASGALVALGCWLAAAVVLAVGPTSWHEPVTASRFVEVTHPPVGAVESVVGDQPAGRSGPAQH